MKKAILYARVSTDDQADKGYSLPSQLEACRKYAERLGYLVVAELREDHSGATPIVERPEGKKVVEMLRARQADALIVYQVDRLSRDIVNLLSAVQMWIRAGIEVHSCDIGKVDSELDIVLVIKGWQGSDERKKIVERTSRGRRTKATAGKVVGGCRCAPYGYRFIRDANNRVIGFEVCESEALVVRLIFHWYVIGDESGKPLKLLQIARKLTEMHISTPGDLHGYRNQARTGKWSHSGIANIIGNETYAGTWHYGKRPGELRERRPAEEHIMVSVPAIVGREIWVQAQVQRKRNWAMAKRNAKLEYLLSSRIKCGCERSMTGAASARKIRWYRCTGIHIIRPDCRERSVHADVIELQVWEGLKGLLSDYERLGRLLRQAQREELEQQEPKRAELEALEKLIAETDQDAADRAMSIRRAKGRVLESPDLQMDEINARYAELTKRRAKLQVELAEQVLTDQAIEDILQYARDVRDGLENADFNMKRINLERLRVQVKVKDGRYFAECIIGEWVGEIRRGGKRGIASGIS